MLLVNACVDAKEPYHWTRGKVLRLYVSPEFSSLNAIGYAQRTKTFTYTIQDGNESLVAQQRAQRAIVAAESEVQYSLSNKSLFIKDAAGKVHKLNLLPMRFPAPLPARMTP
jgi:hypothetical protein